MHEMLFTICALAPAFALFRAQYSRVFPLPSGLIFAAYPPMGYTTILS